MDFEKERRWWNRRAAAFDTIYSAKKNPFSAALDRIFRRDMEGRMLYALEKAAPAPGRHILDVACGTGRFAHACAEGGARVTGVDISENMLALANRIASEKGLSSCSFLQGDFLDTSFDTPFDAITALGLFDYLAEPLLFLRKMLSLSRGPVIASFPRKGTLRARIRSVRLNLLGCRVFFYAEKEIRGLVAEAGGITREICTIGQLHCGVFHKAAHISSAETMR